MRRDIPQRDELLTIRYQKEINAFFEDKKKQLGFDFFGMAERSPYGSMFASSDPSVAHLLYNNNWYGFDPAINREILKLNASESSHAVNQQLYQNILLAKKQHCDQAGNFTIPVILGETELYFCIAAKSFDRLEQLSKHSSQVDLSNLGMVFRDFMHALASPQFSENNKFRESYCYYIYNNFAYEGKETFLSSEYAEKHVEIARFNHRITKLFRITSRNFVGFTSDLLDVREAKLTGKHVEELIIVENSLLLDYKNSIFYPEHLDKEEDKKIVNEARTLLHKDKHTWVKLTSQQYKCFELLIEGHPAKKIADKLHLSTRTVENYLQRIREILGCRNSKEIIATYYTQAINSMS